MNNMRSQILNKSSLLFIRKGFHFTSMQEIADSCEIAKGTLYKFFPSKDELFIEVFNDCFEQFFNEMKFDNGNTPLDRLSQEIAYQISYFVKNSFMIIDYRDVAIQANPKFTHVLNEGRARLLAWHERCLITAYGDIIEPYLGELLIFLRGIIKSYQFFFLESTVNVSINDVAIFIVQQIGAVISNLIETKHIPLINKELLKNSETTDLQARTLKDEIITIFNELNLSVSSLKNNNQKDEASSIVSALLEEIISNKPRIYILHALLSYLRKIHELKSLVDDALELVAKIT
ncbi:transcriptional regulator, TetR family [Clostridium cavendishii DSM 21758]|uniref:Transcriptional regulator, TetR family n=1 Tax=Clostridium cavendishii DSM 21758 TaxID=1121302 RepID=A0A1M6SEI1_9CLOT|nr:TetR/AcrR family transcriptional regulator [Clostridium cavendishii]SHK42967.1 transcriptional regulator, TetR family [Clostridium cavendishii DSM 21758]